MSLSANEVDAHVGQRMRERREALGISQGRLGHHLGLTFSQVQKYEKGSNRIGAGRLYQIAKFLGVEPNYFFQCMGARAEAAAVGNADVERVGQEIVAAFVAISDANAQSSVLALVRSLAAEDKTQASTLHDSRDWSAP